LYVNGESRLDSGNNHRQRPITLSDLQTVFYVYRERLYHWNGPHFVTIVDEKDIAIDLGERSGPRHFNCAQVKPAFLSPEPHDLSTKTVSKEAPILFTEVIKSGDPRAAMFDQAKRDESMGLIERGTFKLVRRKNARPHPNIVPGRFVLAGFIRRLSSS
jgi:hypothetical protein